MLFLSTADVQFCNITDLSICCPTYQTDKQYTVQLGKQNAAQY
jgi:hypothetical protein